MKTTLALTALLSLALLSLVFPAFAQTVIPPGPAATSAAGGTQTRSIGISRGGAQPSSQGPAENFTGAVRVDPMFAANDSSRASGASVSFEPGARSAWHTHPFGQRLIVTAGTGRIQRWGGPVEEMRTGDAVWIPPGVKHWHGAAPNSAMTHIAIQEHLDGKTVDWLEKVSDGQYAGAVASASSAAFAAAPTEAAGAGAARQPSPAQRQFGDIAPKLAQLTDDVLFADVWERPGLSKRDRSLLTVSALIAMNRPDQLRPHLVRARQNGVTRDELVEAITHLAFYAGWPSAVTAASIAKETLRAD